MKSETYYDMPTICLTCEYRKAGAKFSCWHGCTIEDRSECPQSIDPVTKEALSVLPSVVWAWTDKVMGKIDLIGSDENGEYVYLVDAWGLDDWGDAREMTRAELEDLAERSMKEEEEE